ncbi:MAG TPA: hypothetical protein VN428_16095 [Bryobacteraceae bacterium]|nr:hypothetical protein [Bryobacteraceae bacterium]
MLVRERRSRLIRFRVSPDEYETLSRFCAASGARSLSDLARSALQQTMRGQGVRSEAGVTQELRRVDETMRAMNDQIAEIWRLLLEREAGGPRREHRVQEQR